MTKLNLRRAFPVAATALLLSAAFCPRAQSASISYSFTQGGFTDSAGDTGTLSGSFTGNPEANGVLQLSDLTGFTADFSETVNGISNTFEFLDANDFYYDPNTPGSLAFSSGSLASDIIACTGSTDVNAVCAGVTSPLSPRLDAFGFFEDLPDFGESLTKQASVVTLASSASAPEPGTTLLLSTGLCLLLAGSVRRRRMYALVRVLRRP